MDVVAEAFWNNDNRFYLVSGESLPDEIVIAFHEAKCQCVDNVVMIGDCDGGLITGDLSHDEWENNCFRQYDAIDNDKVADIITQFDVIGIWNLETTGYQTMTRKNR